MQRPAPVPSTTQPSSTWTSTGRASTLTKYTGSVTSTIHCPNDAVILDEDFLAESDADGESGGVGEVSDPEAGAPPPRIKAGGGGEIRP